MTSTLSRFVRPLRSLAVLAGAAVLGSPSACLAETRTYDMWWAPKCVTVGGHEIDRLMMFIFWLTLTVFILTQTFYIYFLVKYRARRGVKAVYSHGNNRLEVIWTTIPAVIFICLAVVSDRLWLQLRSKAPADALHIDIVAYQFGFHIRNPGVDDKLGSYNQLWIDKGTNNFGVDLKDPASRDDYQSENQLTLPVNRPVNVALRSMDVIHAFYVPEFRMYQDIVPGREIDWVWFTPEKVGHYALACNQLCGAGHFNMQAKIDVVSQADYAKLVAEKSAAALEQRKQQDANAAKAAAADGLPALPATTVAKVSLPPAADTSAP
jgi:cytochrome c oxidase subunit 2